MSEEIPYTAMSLSVSGRFVFLYMLYVNKSVNGLSLLLCCMSIASSSMWMYYSIKRDDSPMIVRSSADILLLVVSSIYIIRNKAIKRREELKTSTEVYTAPRR